MGAHRKSRGIDKCIADFAANLAPGATVLDIGCGTGYPVAQHLDANSFRVTGIDISEEMIRCAEKLHLTNAKFIVGDILHFQSHEAFDAVIAFDSLFHIDYSRQQEIYPLISSLLKPGGYFLFTHGKQNGEVIGTMFGQRFYYSALNVSAVRSLLLQNGFEILSLTEDYTAASTGNRDLLVIARKRTE